MLKTEMRNPNTMHIDKMTSLEMAKVMARENYRAVEAVEEQVETIAKAIDLVAGAFDQGGRLFFMGCGTSGRLGVLDAAECPPTFGVDPSMVQGMIAGGEKRMFTAGENEEDKEEKGVLDVETRGIRTGDVLVGVSVAGGAAYVVGGLQRAKELGATTIALTSNEGTAIGAISDLCIIADTGAEVITGSTRLKAGTAHKMVMNMLTTCAMVKTGRVYENMMVNLKPSNVKLRQRVIRIVCDICGCGGEKAVELLDAVDWDIRSAAELYRSQNKAE